MPTFHKPSSGKRWSSEEVRLLRRLVKEGLPFTMMVIYSRNAHAIMVKARQLNLQVATRWSKQEVDKLVKGIQSGLPTSQITIRNHRTKERRPKHAVRAKALRLGLIATLPSRQKWADAEIQLLKVLANQGLTPRAIKEQGLFGPERVDASGRTLPKRSCNALAKMAGRLGLGNAERKEMARDAKRMITREFSQRLNSFIREYGKAMPARDIAAIFGVSSSTVRRRREKLRVKVTWHDAVKMPDSRFKSPRFAQMRSERSRRSWAKRR